jgi:AAA domain
MQPAKTPCSDLGARRGPLLVLEGMPGAGKTTTATRLAAEGQRVIGEYVTPAGATIPVAGHPPACDDNAHQANWLTKHRHATAALAAGPVFCDRDWLSALAYAASLPEGDQLLRAHVWRAVEQLRRGQLAVADGYLVLHLDPAATSLAASAAVALLAGIAAQVATLAAWERPTLVTRAARPRPAAPTGPRWYYPGRPIEAKVRFYLEDLLTGGRKRGDHPA